MYLNCGESMKFAIGAEVEHATFGRGITRSYNSLNDMYSVQFGRVNIITRSVKEKDLSKPAYSIGPVQKQILQFQ